MLQGYQAVFSAFFKFLRFQPENLDVTALIFEKFGADICEKADVARFANETPSNWPLRFGYYPLPEPLFRDATLGAEELSGNRARHGKPAQQTLPGRLRVLRPTP
ncbi:MAG: hypothetical protein H6566_05600 [Lewinellaceae bacterium]|nr:hypothetical protein [Lewinellaceae bacterium]